MAETGGRRGGGQGCGGTIFFFIEFAPSDHKDDPNESLGQETFPALSTGKLFPPLKQDSAYIYISCIFDNGQATIINTREAS